jgi:hypothetical protein
MSAVPADARTPVLEDVLHLLNPMAMHARLRLVPADGPLTGKLAEQVQEAARLATAEPETVSTVARQLAEVRGSPVGGWLRPGSAGHPDIDLARVIRDRSAALFRTDSPGVARLVCADLLALGSDLRRLEIDGDAVVVLCGCEKLPSSTVSSLVDSGATVGLPVLATTTSAMAAAGLADVFGTLVMHRLAAADARVGAPAAGSGRTAGPGTATSAGNVTAAEQGTDSHSSAASLAARTGTRLIPAAAAAAQAGPSPQVPAGGTCDLVPQPAVTVRTLLSLRTAQFAVAVQAPRPRLVTLAQTVPARLPRPARAPDSSPAETKALDRLWTSVIRSAARAVTSATTATRTTRPSTAPEAAASGAKEAL